MRQFTMDQLKPSLQQVAKINKELFVQGTKTGRKVRDNQGISPELAAAICRHNWSKLVKMGKITALEPRTWLMEWDY